MTVTQAYMAYELGMICLFGVALVFMLYGFSQRKIIPHFISTIAWWTFAIAYPLSIPLVAPIAYFFMALGIVELLIAMYGALRAMIEHKWGDLA